MDRPVLILAGAGSLELASTLLTEYDLHAWDAAPDPASVAGRHIRLWGVDSAEIARVAAQYLPTAESVSVVDIREEPELSDFGAVLGAYGTVEGVREFIDGHLLPLAKPGAEAPPAVKRGRKRDNVAPVAGGSAVSTLQSLPLDCNSQGMPHPTVTNAAVILTHHPQYAGCIWFDDFRRKIMLEVDGKHRPWTDADDLAALAFMNNTLMLPKVGLQTVSNAVHMAAFMARRNSVCDYLNSLTWDGTERLSLWVCDFLGVPNTPYAQAAGRNWLISMVARAMRPGCQADHMPVLEGLSGRGKSSSLAILGGEWYRAAPQAFGSKEFFEVIQGAWLVEIPDMVGFGKREHSQIISAITTRSDSYRASYGRHAEDHPRTVIFVATSETDEYLQDSRGVRRYWPLRCGEINLEALTAVRDQLFAEATWEFNRGAAWHEMPVEETRGEQELRQETDPWMDRIAQFAASREKVVVTDVLDICLEIEKQKQSRSEQMRVAKCLQRMGFVSRVEKESGSSRRVYRRK